MLSQTVKNISPSLTMKISALAKQMKANEQDVVNMSIGEPDFFTPEKAKLAAIDAINKNLTKYDAASGLSTLKKIIVQKLKKENKFDAKPENIVISAGAKQSLTNTFLSVLDKDDEVIIPAPYWVSYPELVKISGGKPIFVNTKKENSFLITLDELKTAITPKTKAFILNSPSNPTGSVYKKKQLEEICGFLTEKNILIVADEIYERFIYEDSFTSVLSLSKKITDNTILINGFSKTYSMTGWRVGYSVSPAELASAMSSLQSHMTSHPCTISQYAAVAAMSECEIDVTKMCAAYKQRRDYIVEFFETWKKLDIIKPNGAFYVFVDISPMTKNIHAENKSEELCHILLSKYKLACVPGAGFGNDEFIRLSYACSMENIKKGLSALKACAEDLL